jgi:hypothetical protein
MNRYRPIILKSGIGIDLFSGIIKLIKLCFSLIKPTPPQFRITQDERDLIVLKRIIESMGCGILVNNKSKDKHA